jgi:CheY-like chemotaxis protein
VATILLVEDRPDLGLYEAGLLEQAGHRVIRCGGGPTPHAACPMLRNGSCPLPDGADLVVFSCAMFAPMPGRSYRGGHLLRAYRAHPRYGRLPMLVVSVGAPDDVGGTGPLAKVDKFSSPGAVLEAAEALLRVR